MHTAYDLSLEELNDLNEIVCQNGEHDDVPDLENISLRVGAGSPHPATPRSDRQYEGFLPDYS